MVPSGQILFPKKFPVVLKKKKPPKIHRCANSDVKLGKYAAIQVRMFGRQTTTLNICSRASRFFLGRPVARLTPGLLDAARDGRRAVHSEQSARLVSRLVGYTVKKHKRVSCQIQDG